MGYLYNEQGDKQKSLSLAYPVRGCLDLSCLQMLSSGIVYNFKRALKNSVFITPKVPSFYIKGNRRMSIYHARLRNKCSDLNNVLYVNHIKVATCECGVDVENAEHYFFKCVRFAEQRLALFRATRQFHR